MKANPKREREMRTDEEKETERARERKIIRT
jgi:hypothetical protein